MVIAVIVPARDEAEVIGRAVTSLLRQSCIEALHIFVVDDNSTDGTADAVRRAAAQSEHGERVRVIRGLPLPAGWTGKLWAVKQGIDEALALRPDFLLLTDADIEHSPDNVATLVHIALAGGYDLVSFMVKLRCRSLAEKLLVPAFVFFFLLLYPPWWVRNPRRKTAGAAGGCLMVRPAALERAGSIAAIRHEIIDDCALARAVKRSGGKIWLGLTQQTHSLRVYGSFAEIEAMIARNAFNQLRHSFWLLLGTVLGGLAVFVLPLVLPASGSAHLAMAGGAVYLAMCLAYWPMVRFYRLNPLWALTLPFSGVFFLAATIHSAVKYWSGQGGEWKGRAQDLAQPRS
ncbi:MAG TPA: glycosyltransferase [Terriglobales bacterium]|nr:glycosyltransferase [Terriglobales bacterium]